MDDIGMSEEDERPDQETTAPNGGIGPQSGTPPWWVSREESPTPAPDPWHAPGHVAWPPPTGADWGPPPSPPAPSFPQPPKRRRWAGLAALVAGLVLLSSGIGIGWSLSRGDHNSSSSQTEAPLRTVPQT